MGIGNIFDRILAWLENAKEESSVTHEGNKPGGDSPTERVHSEDEE